MDDLPKHPILKCQKLAPDTLLLNTDFANRSIVVGKGELALHDGMFEQTEVGTSSGVGQVQTQAETKL
ncbi:MAG: hypothetical protein HC810_01875 [Acaryochloridaceae cyanobacterium RL_2_7]|nr:hypothetical protein [Acaryochloridaceae cyanobacterium RL_2_7]